MSVSKSRIHLRECSEFKTTMRVAFVCLLPVGAALWAVGLAREALHLPVNRRGSVLDETRALVNETIPFAYHC